MTCAQIVMLVDGDVLRFSRSIEFQFSAYIFINLQLHFNELG